ncbi:XdhC/CoxI family protein [Echinicola strongylocentroti]|uniref:XdhC/CoxI family protein n=1 Tax=Echinicola strongylocentroti TaxID=1795355 RepID=A0A2Z4IF15_9BACT|nr:XdhC/CoxI family protein [Echinicola strongylocentroti]AWW29682.1 XdhC/CoxI family protein [Echinicola strongylocentroti]
MREIENIFLAYKKAKSTGLDCVLATVVHVEGSAYRRPGARMLVDEQGLMTGAISGGCLEGDALRKSLHALHQNRNKLITYDTSDETDAVIGAQLGCNGIIQVLFEPIDYSNPTNPVELLKEALETNDESVLVSLFNLQKRQHQMGTCLLFKDNQKTIGECKHPELYQRIKSDARFTLAEHTSCFRTYLSKESEVQAFFQLVPQPVHLVIVGAGNDARILASMADCLGWNISVTDGRATHANKERFIGACQVIVSEPEKALESLDINANTVFVLMTHNYKYDLAVLELLLLKEPLPYIGILGPKKKYHRMLEDLASKGIHPNSKQKSRIYAPIGLDLHSETPAEIALSILSEIQKVLVGSSGDHLKNKKERIHIDEDNEFRLVQLENS